ncbi:hypothetical protein MKX83_23980 [Cytobacillus sp. FSL M8-0252]|uniref:hypothetical protein n=1 Tax=Cytobacillus sp. FSL M8-0252 TaxID=2921621 RepID=UPI0030FB6E79
MKKDTSKDNNLNDINKKINLLKTKKENLKKEIEYKNKQNYRKERARRLIETGALAEKYFEISNLTIDEREKLFKMFSPFIIGNKPKEFKNNYPNKE